MATSGPHQQTSLRMTMSEAPGIWSASAVFSRAWHSLKHLVTRGNLFFFAEGTLFLRSIRLSRRVTEKLTQAGLSIVEGTAYQRMGVRLSHLADMNVDGVLVNSVGRFGNSVIQFGNALEIARALEAREIRYFRWDAIGNQDFSVDDTTVSRLPALRSGKNGISRVLWRTQAFRGALIDFDTSTRQPPSWTRNLASAHSLEPGKIRKQSQVLTIHLRSGDVFGVRPHPEYGQPPFAFYERVLRHRNWNSVRLVTEDDSNPCREKILGWCEENGIPCLVSGSDIGSSIEILRSSAHIAIGQGTFVPAIQLLDDEARSFYVFSSEPHPLLLMKPNSIFQVSDNDGAYIAGVMNQNWRNSEEQRNLMRNYPVANLSKPRRPNASPVSSLP